MQIKDIAEVAQGLATSGRGAGAREGDWRLDIVDSADIEDDRVVLDGLRTIGVERNTWTEKHLLRPFDVLVTARAQGVRVALVPPEVSRTVASATLLVVRARAPETGLAHLLWYYLTSKQGREQIRMRIKVGSTIPSLSAAALREIDVPVPPVQELDRIARLVEASEDAYAAAVDAATMRREALRDAVIQAVTRSARIEGETE